VGVRRSGAHFATFNGGTKSKKGRHRRRITDSGGSSGKVPFNGFL
jgi:hypothetical protein